MEKKAVVFDIQKYSIHDGPGIRTLIFLKGCNMNCHWCANPESRDSKPQILFNEELCLGCGRCVEQCLEKAVYFDENRLIYDRNICKNCGRCTDICYTGARTLCGKKMSCEEVMNIILHDEIFYLRSSGGVTLGGGEPLLQSDFVSILLKECKKNGINTAVETAGNVPWSEIKKVYSFVDYFLYDLKHIDSIKHKKYTGVDNKLILENLEMLNNSYKNNIIIRTPVIPGFNDTIVEFEKIIVFVRKLGLKELHLLPYHRYGVNKYRFLGLDYPFRGVKEPDDNFISRMKDNLSNKGVKIKISG